MRRSLSPQAAHENVTPDPEVANQGGVFGYSPPSRMMSGEEPEGDEVINDAVNTESYVLKFKVGELRQVIKEEMTSVNFKLIDLNVLKKKWPRFYDYLDAKFSEELPKAKVAVKKTGMFSADPYVMLSDRNRTVLFWSKEADRFAYSSSETIARALARL